MFIKTEETSVSYIKTMFIKVNQGINHPEAGLMYTVLIGNPKIYKKRVITYQEGRGSFRQCFLT